MMCYSSYLPKYTLNTMSLCVLFGFCYLNEKFQNKLCNFFDFFEVQRKFNTLLGLKINEFWQLYTPI